MQKACFLSRLLFGGFFLVHFAFWIHCLLLEETESLISSSMKIRRKFKIKCYSNDRICSGSYLKGGTGGDLC